MNIPSDPYILYSFINMKLRNDFHTLEELCLCLDLNKEEICQKLAKAGFHYDPQLKQFR
ncbi:MAG: DUF4250 domain-containing protein [Akkermansia sp.]